MVCIAVKTNPNDINKNALLKNVSLLPDWRNLDLDTPYFDNKQNKYFITVPTQYSNPGETLLPGRMEEAKEPGVMGLLNVYGKENNNINVQLLTASAEAVDYFIPIRPDIVCDGKSLFGMKILIAVPENVLDALPKIKIEQSLAELPLAKREFNLTSDTLKSKIKLSSEIMKSYAEDAKNMQGDNSVLALMLNKEAERVEDFAPVLENLLIANGFPLKQEQSDLIIIGIDDKYHILYVLFNSAIDSGLFHLENTFNIFKSTTPARSDRTVSFVSKLDNIIQEGSKTPKTPLIEFLQLLVLRTPQISPQVAAHNAFAPSFNDFANSFGNLMKKSNAKPFKTEAEKEAEDNVLFSSKFKNSLYISNKNKADVVEDITLSTPNLSRVIKKIESLDDFFNKMFNKVTICDLVGKALKCLPIPDPCMLLRSALSSLSITDLLTTLAEKANINIEIIPQLQKPIRESAVSCYKSLSRRDQNDIANFIFNQTSFPVSSAEDLLSLPITSIKEAFNIKNIDILKVAFKEHHIGIEFPEGSVGGDCVSAVLRIPGAEDVPFNVSINIDLAPIKKCELPSLDLNDLLPTIDIMAEISLRIEIGITDAIITILIDLIKAITIAIFENCGNLSNINFGVLNPINLLEQSLNFKIDAHAFVNMQTKLLGAININGNVNISPEIFAKRITDFISDLSLLLSPPEISDLLGGFASKETLQITNCLVNTKYSDLKTSLDEPTKVEDLFQAFGAVINKDVLLKQISEKNEDFKVFQDFCDEPNDNSRKKLLENRGLSPAEVNQQLALNNKKRQDSIRNLQDLLNKGNVLDGVLPPVFCDSKNSNQKGSLIPRDHPSFDHVLDKTINTVYDGVHISFNQDISGFAVALKETTTVQKPRDIPRQTMYTPPNAAPLPIPNPEFLRIVAQGVAVKDPSNLDLEPVKAYEDPNFISNFVAKGLKENLASIEFNSQLFKLDPNLGKISFIIPHNIDSKVLSSTDVLSSGTFSTVDNSVSGTSKDFAAVQNELDALKPVSYQIDYMLPTGSIVNDEIEQYSIAINNSIGSETKELFKITRNNNISSSVLDFIRTNQLDLLANTSLPQSYFSSFVSNIWKDGGTIYTTDSGTVKPDYSHGVGVSNNLRSINGIFRNKIKGEVYENIFVDLLSAMARQVSKSPIFDSKILSLINFTPDKQSNGCIPSLLDLQKIKNKMKSDFKNSECKEDIMPSVDGLGKSTPNALEQAGITGAIQTFIRLYTIELILKSIFVFSEFKLSDISELDDLLISYFVNEINKGISNIGILTNDLQFKDQFDKEVLKAFNSKIDNLELTGSQTKDINVALNALIKEELIDVIKKISDLIGSSGNINIFKVLVEEWLPLFEVGNGNVRFAEGTQGNLTNIKQSQGIKNNNKVIFNLENGNLILERYIRIDEKSQNSNSTVQTSRIGDSLYGIANLNDFNKFVTRKMHQIENRHLRTKIKFDDEFAGFNYGLRLSYVPKFKTSFQTENPPAFTPGVSTTRNTVEIINDGSLTSELFVGDARIKVSKEAKLDKAFKIYEGFNTTIQNDFKDSNQPKINREINLFPVVSVELPEEDLVNFTTQDSVIDRWNSKSTQLVDMLMNTDEFKFMFNFCFPLSRMLSLIIVYNIVYLSNVQKLIDLFNGTKTSLKMVFQALLNSGDYRFNDPYINQIGGNAGISTLSQNNLNTDPNVPGLSLASIAAKTPYLILKGLVELTDTNIGRARKIVDAAKDAGHDITIHKASLAQLPMNVFPPFPFGPGIGPPITPLGFLYLALDLDNIFNSAKGKDLKRIGVLDSIGLNLNSDLSSSC